MNDEDQRARLVRGPQDTTALVGDRVLLKATYVGHPEPTVRWTKAVSWERTNRTDGSDFFDETNAGYCLVNCTDVWWFSAF